MSQKSQKSQKPRPDYSAWLTKQQAADAIGVSTKTVEKLAQDRKIEQALWRRPTGGAHVAVFQPDDVARIANEKHPTAAPFVLPPMGTGAITLAPLPQPSDATGRALSALLGALHVSSENSQKTSALFLTVAEASEVSGLSQAYLRRLIEDGKLPAIRDRGWRIRRRDLEAL